MTGEVSHFAQNAAAYPESTVEVFSCSVNYGEYHLSSHIVRVSVLNATRSSSQVSPTLMVIALVAKHCLQSCSQVVLSKEKHLGFRPASSKVPPCSQPSQITRQLPNQVTSS